LVFDFVGETLLAPLLSLDYDTAIFGDDLFDAVENRNAVLLLCIGAQDDS